MITVSYGCGQSRSWWLHCCTFVYPGLGLSHHPLSPNQFVAQHFAAPQSKVTNTMKFAYHFEIGESDSPRYIVDDYLSKKILYTLWLDIAFCLHKISLLPLPHGKWHSTGDGKVSGRGRNTEKHAFGLLQHPCHP